MIEFRYNYWADCHSIREEYDLFLTVFVHVYDSVGLVKDTSPSSADRPYSRLRLIGYLLQSENDASTSSV